MHTKLLASSLSAVVLLSASAWAIDVPRPNIPQPNIPKPQVNVPKPTVAVPRVQVNVPKPTVTAPKVQVNVPKPTVAAPKVQVNVPKPTVEVAKPPITVSKPTNSPPEVARTTAPAGAAVTNSGTGGSNNNAGIATGKSNTSQQGAATGKDTASQQGAATGKSNTSQQGAATGKDTASQQGAATGKSNTSQQGAATGKDTASQQGAATAKGDTSQQGAATGKDTASQQGAATAKGDTSQQGAATGNGNTKAAVRASSSGGAGIISGCGEGHAPACSGSGTTNNSPLASGPPQTGLTASTPKTSNTLAPQSGASSTTTGAQRLPPDPRDPSAGLQVGQQYSYTSGTPEYHPQQCSGNTCNGVFRGVMPNGATSNAFGGYDCSTCQPGIYVIQVGGKNLAYGMVYPSNTPASAGNPSSPSVPTAPIGQPTVPTGTSSPGPSGGDGYAIGRGRYDYDTTIYVARPGDNSASVSRAGAATSNAISAAGAAANSQRTGPGQASGDPGRSGLGANQGVIAVGNQNFVVTQNADGSFSVPGVNGGAPMTKDQLLQALTAKALGGSTQVDNSSPSGRQQPTDNGGANIGSSGGASTGNGNPRSVSAGTPSNNTSMDPSSPNYGVAGQFPEQVLKDIGVLPKDATGPSQPPRPTSAPPSPSGPSDPSLPTPQQVEQNRQNNAQIHHDPVPSIFDTISQRYQALEREGKFITPPTSVPSRP